MLATPISNEGVWPNHPPGARLRREFCLSILPSGWLPALLAIFLLAAFFPDAALGSSTEDRARKAFIVARVRYEKSRSNPQAAWEFGRSAYDLADAVDDNQQRKEVAEEGIAACRQGLLVAPNNAGAHYYLALNLGEMARAKKFGALKLLNEMEGELKKALEADPAFDYAGADRSLGMLYLEAPAFPIGIGNRNKARTHLEAAVARNPEYLENQICLAEGYARWEEVKNLQARMKIIHDQLPAARSHFTGSNWSESWLDWNARLKKLETAEAGLLAAPHASPAERGMRRR